MKHSLQVQLIFHGGVILLIGLLTGVPLMLAIDYNWGDFPIHVWAVAHTSVTLTGVAFMAISGVLDHLILSEAAAKFMVRTLMICAYTFTAGLMISAFAGVRGLAPMGPALNWAAFILFVIGAFAIVIGVITLIWGAHRAQQAEK